MGKHAKLSASGFDRWGNCPGSIRECEGMPNIESEAASEGTKAHDKAERFVRGEMPAEEFHKLPEDMANAIKVYYDTIFDDRFGTKWPIKENETQLFLEHKFDLSEVYPGCFGTSDAVMWNPANKTLYVYDFKYGKGKWVDHRDNWQLKYYALGALLSLGFPAEWVEIVVVQPRCIVKKHEQGGNGVRRERVSAMELSLDFRDFMYEKAVATEDPKAPLVPGQYCYFCPAHTKCPAKVAERLEKAKDSFDEVPEDDDPFADDPFA